MKQKRVSFKVAKAIKEAGYPQECGLWWSQDGREFSYTEDYSKHYARPTYLDVWLWLWIEKGIKLSVEPNEDEAECYTKDLGKLISKFGNNPEEAIVEAIEYLVDNNLLK